MINFCPTGAPVTARKTLKNVLQSLGCSAKYGKAVSCTAERQLTVAIGDNTGKVPVSEATHPMADCAAGNFQHENCLGRTMQQTAKLPCRVVGKHETIGPERPPPSVVRWQIMRRLISWQGVLACLTLLLILLAVVTFLPRLVYPSMSASELCGVADAATRITLQNAGTSFRTISAASCCRSSLDSSSLPAPQPPGSRSGSHVSARRPNGSPRRSSTLAVASSTSGSAASTHSSDSR